MSHRGATERLTTKRQLQNKAGRFTDGYAQGYRDGWNDRGAEATPRHRSTKKKATNRKESQ
jgi:hypothetical protein